MKPLSELIMQGCQFAPTQGFNSFWSKDGSCACAMGAAILAIEPTAYLHESAEMWEVLEATIGYGTTSLRIIDPISKAEFNLETVVFHLNDRHKWTREDIAKWLKEQGL